MEVHHHYRLLVVHHLLRLANHREAMNRHGNSSAYCPQIGLRDIRLSNAQRSKARSDEFLDVGHDFEPNRYIMPDIMTYV